MKLALIGTFYKRYENTYKLLHTIFKESSRIPDEVWLMCESAEDARQALDFVGHEQLIIKVLPTPKTEEGKYSVIPYSNKINWALDHTTADVITYLDNGSFPDPQKYDLMYNYLLDNPTHNVVYCSQERLGYINEFSLAKDVIPDAYCVLNYTQVMHRKTSDRWTLDMAHASPDLADAIFWRSLHASIGDFYPVNSERILDVHYISGPKAEGVE